MGKSRSATVCIAFLLHRKLATSPLSALELIKKSRAMCEPNDGFMKQLDLYDEMDCPENIAKHPVYQRWLYQRGVDESVACGRGPELDVVRFEDEELELKGSDQAEIKCRKCRYGLPFSFLFCGFPPFTFLPSSCIVSWSKILTTGTPSNRRILATTPFIIPHEQQLPRKPTGRPLPAHCAHIFLHPLTWMRESLYPSSTDPQDTSSSHEYSGSPEAPLSGRLTCPNSSCGCNIGKFAWQGMRCSCGIWVTPAIAVVRAKVDIIDASVRSSSANIPAVGIRHPPGMKQGVPEPGAGRGLL